MVTKWIYTKVSTVEGGSALRMVQIPRAGPGDTRDIIMKDEGDYKTRKNEET